MQKKLISGFFYGYTIVAISFLLQAAGWGVFNSLGVFFNPLMAEFGWPRALVASTISMGMLVLGASAVIQGRLSDRYGPRLTMAVSGIFLGAGFVLMAGVSSIWHMYLCLSLLAGIGVSGTDVVLLSTTTRWFIRKRGMMIGIVKVGTGVGMIIMPLVINAFIGAFGWRRAFVALGIICLATYLLGSRFLVRDPGKHGLQPDGDTTGAGRNAEATEHGMKLKQATRTLPFWTLCGAYFIVFFSMSTILIHLVPHAIDLGFPSSDAAAVLATLGAMSIGGRFVMGAAGDRIGNRAALIISFACVTTGFVWLQFADELWMLYLFALLHGFAHGAFFALVAPLPADYFGTRDHGVIMGIVIFVATIGGSTGPVLAGWMFDTTGSYRIIFLLLTGLSIAGFCAATSLRPVPMAERGRPAPSPE